MARAYHGAGTILQNLSNSPLVPRRREGEGLDAGPRDLTPRPPLHEWRGGARPRGPCAVSPSPFMERGPGGEVARSLHLPCDEVLAPGRPGVRLPGPASVQGEDAHAPLAVVGAGEVAPPRRHAGPGD